MGKKKIAELTFNVARERVLNLAATQDTQTYQENWQLYSAEVNAAGNDRGAAILIATAVEIALEKALTRMLDSKRLTHAFGSRGPLREFGAKIEMAYALNLFGEITYRNLEIIKNIRNIFAHSHVSIDFKNGALTDLMTFLTVPELKPSEVSALGIFDEDRKSDRALFKQVCDLTSHNLIMLHWPHVQRIHRSVVLASFDENFTDIRAYHEPLA